jgi:tetratricopeptide (TPR) repeat protein
MGTEKELIKVDIDYSKLTEEASKFCKRGCYDLAIKEYTKVIDSEAFANWPKSLKATLYYDRGTSYSDACNYEKALEDLNKAIEIAPEYPGAYNNRGNVYKKMKEYDKAIADHTQALGFNPKDAGYIYFNRGTTYLNTGRLIDCIPDFYHGFKLQPKYGLRVFGPFIIVMLFSIIGFIFNKYYK